MTNVTDQIFALSPDIRYVAIYRDETLSLSQRDNLSGASDSESDRYEELLVNPTLLTLARQRGNIDCGGLNHIIIAYGNFQQLVIPLENGHVSVAFELGADPVGYVSNILALMTA